LKLFRKKQSKIKSISCSIGKANSSINLEAKVTNSLLILIACVPNLHFVGDEKQDESRTYHVMVMDLLGKSLEDLF
jgi:hypothetical protein